MINGSLYGVTIILPISYFWKTICNRFFSESLQCCIPLFHWHVTIGTTYISWFKKLCIITRTRTTTVKKTTFLFLTDLHLSRWRLKPLHQFCAVQCDASCMMYTKTDHTPRFKRDCLFFRHLSRCPQTKRRELKLCRFVIKLVKPVIDFYFSQLLRIKIIILNMNTKQCLFSSLSC